MLSVCKVCPPISLVRITALSFFRAPRRDAGRKFPAPIHFLARLFSRPLKPLCLFRNPYPKTSGKPPRTIRILCNLLYFESFSALNDYTLNPRPREHFHKLLPVIYLDDRKNR